jgi:hypothetical protein
MGRNDDKPTAIMLRNDNARQVMMLSDAEAGQVFKAILHYAATGEDISTRSRVLRIVFEGLRMQIDHDSERYKAKCERNRAIAEERERRKREAQADTNVLERDQTCTNVNECAHNIKLNTSTSINTSTSTSKHTLSVCEITGARACEDDYVKEAGADVPWMESCCMALHIPMEEAGALLQAFALECKAKGAQHINGRDFRSHYVDWARIQVEKKQKSKPAAQAAQNVNDLW